MISSIFPELSGLLTPSWGRSRWPRDFRKLGWFSCARHLEKSVQTALGIHCLHRTSLSCVPVKTCHSEQVDELNLPSLATLMNRMSITSGQNSDTSLASYNIHYTTTLHHIICEILKRRGRLNFAKWFGDNGPGCLWTTNIGWAQT